jgi:hypothetical protein
MKKTFIGILLSLMLTFFVSGQAMAVMTTSTANVTAQLDLTGLPTTGFTWSADLYTDAGASLSSSLLTAFPANPPYGASNGPGSILASMSSFVSNGPANATGIAAAGLYTSYAQASSPSSSSVGTVYGSGSFLYTGTTGSVFFSIPYSWAMDLQAANPGFAEGYYKIWFEILVGQTNMLHESTDRKVVNGGSYSHPIFTTETFDFYVELTKGQSYNFDFGTETRAAAATVPLPAAFWFLGSGLVGLVGIRRKRV